MIKVTANTDAVKKQFLKTADDLVQQSNPKILLVSLQKSMEKYLESFCNEFQVKYLDIADYFLKQYGNNLDKETQQILKAITDEKIYDAFSIKILDRKIILELDDNLLFFIGALEYGTKQIVPDRTMTQIKSDMIKIARNKLDYIIKDILDKNFPAKR